MEINSLQGAAAYASSLGATQPVENTQTRDQNVEASRTDLTTQSTSVAQEAFEVTITQEAQDRLAEDTAVEETDSQEQVPVQAQPLEEQPPEPEQSPAETSQIVNIVA